MLAELVDAKKPVSKKGLMQSSFLDQYATTAALYDFVHPYRTRADVDFFVELGRESGGPVLELGCGTGRVLLPTARAGIDITGLDASTAMLDVCRGQLEGEPAEVRARVTLVQGDMRGINTDGSFSLVTLPFRPFQHLLRVEDQLACLESIYRRLAPGGRVVLDLFNPMLERLAPGTPEAAFEDEREVELPDGRRMVRRGRVTAHDMAKQIITAELVHEIKDQNGNTESIRQVMRLRYCFRFEAEHLLARCGFGLEALYSDYDKTPFGDKYPGEILCIAKKP